MARFFISYSRSIKDDVHKIINLLRASGHEVWWDGDIPIMADWWATILDHIEWCDIFIFIASEKSVESPYCLAELRYANERGRLILPLIWESPDTFSLPAELPHRNQWLIFDGDPVTMLGQINTAYGLIDGNYPQDIEAQRPPEPNTGETSIIKQYQGAFQLAYAMDFEQAKRILRNLKRLDPKGWGQDCNKWLAQINAYAPLVELIDHESTYERASQGWLAYVRQYGLEFDPYQIEDKIRQYQVNHQLNQPPTVPISEPTTNQTSKSLFGILSVLGILVVGVIAFIIFQNIGNNDPQLANPTEIVVIPTDEPAQLSTVSTEALVIDQPLSVDEIALSTINARATEIEYNNQATATAQTQHNHQATTTAFPLTQSAEQTRHAIEVETRVIELQATLTTWTPTITNTPRPTSTPRTTITNTPSARINNISNPNPQINSAVNNLLGINSVTPSPTSTSRTTITNTPSARINNISNPNPQINNAISRLLSNNNFNTSTQTVINTSYSTNYQINQAINRLINVDTNR
jgi:hypothetical protein